MSVASTGPSGTTGDAGTAASEPGEAPGVGCPDDKGAWPAEALDAQRQGLARLADETQGRLEERRRELLELRVPAEPPAGQSAPTPRNEGGGTPD